MSKTWAHTDLRPVSSTPRQHTRVRTCPTPTWHWWTDSSNTSTGAVSLQLLSVIIPGVCAAQATWWCDITHTWTFTAPFTRWCSLSSGLMLTDVNSKLQRTANFHVTSEMTPFSCSGRKFWLVQVSRHWSCVWISALSRRDEVCFRAVELPLMPQLG